MQLVAPGQRLAGGRRRAGAQDARPWQDLANARRPDRAGRARQPLRFFGASAVRGEHCWIAGTPGTPRAAHAPTRASTWQLRPTGQSLPIHALTFVDERNGWAVGELGHDSGQRAMAGKTWRTQRSAARELRISAFTAAPRTFRWNWSPGFRPTRATWARSRFSTARMSSAASGAPSRCGRPGHEASVLAGGSAAGGAWRFPLRSAGLKLSAEQLVEAGTRPTTAARSTSSKPTSWPRIRMWRPSVVFTASADARGARSAWRTSSTNWCCAPSSGPAIRRSIPTRSPRPACSLGRCKRFTARCPRARAAPPT